MTKKNKYGTLSTRASADKKVEKDIPVKEVNVDRKMKELLGLNKIRFLSHANRRMREPRRREK